MAVGRRLRDCVVQAADGTGQAVDLLADALHLAVDEAVLLAEAVVQGVEAPRQAVGVGQHQLPRRGIGGVFGGGLERGEELLQRRADARGGAGQQRIQLVDLAAVGRHVTVQRGGVAQLRGEEFAVGAPHFGERRAGTDVARAAELGEARSLGGVLAAEPRRVDVGDVVAGDGQLGLADGKPGQSDVQQVSHDSEPHVLVVVPSTAATAW
ncbi:hypothetical protein FQZ97_931970 [compost metagenome]